MKRLAALLIAWLGSIVGGQQINPAFEVASVKRNTSGEYRQSIQPLPGGRLTATNVPTRALIRYAFELQDFELAEGPGWLTSERFDIVAKAEQGASPAETRLMLSALLADRFRLTVHKETRDLPFFALVISRSDHRMGPQLRPTEADCASAVAPRPDPSNPLRPSACGFFGLAPGVSLGRSNLAFRGMTMGEFARALVPLVSRNVIDRTGLEGHFDGDFDFTTELGPPPPPPGVPDPFDRASFPSIFTVLPDRLGLKLDSGKGPVDVLVIDRVERPNPD